MILWRLKEVAAARRMSGAELAEKVGVSANSIYRLWRPTTMPRLEHDMLDKLCNALKCQPGDLLTQVEDSLLETCSTIEP
jgi:putative transcriptional regulator